MEASGLYKRGNNYWMRFRFSGERIHETTGTSNKSEAVKVLMQKKYALMAKEEQGSANGFTTDTVDIPFSEAGIKAYELHFSQQRSAYATLTKQNVLNKLIGHMPVSTVDPSVFTMVEMHLRKRGCSLNTINRYFNTMNVTLELARKKLDAPCSPVPKVKLKTKRTAIRSISRTEEEKILEWFNHPQRTVRAYAGWSNVDLLEIYSVGIATGMRRGELLSFRVEQVQGQLITLPPEQHKTGDTQGDKTVVLSEEARDLIAARIERLGLKAGDKVFNYSIDAYTRLWWRLKEDIGIPTEDRFSPHCMRHTFATRMAEKGMSIYHVSKMLGHTTVKTTEMYAHLFKDELITAMNKYAD